MTTPSPQRPAAPSPSEPPKKRAKYTQIACNECKRRKIKCTGGSPCSRCSRGKVFCSYPSDRTPIHETEFKDARVGSRFESIDQQLEEMQREMRTMSARLRQLEASSPNSIMPAKTNTQKELNRILNAPKSPTYVGPTSVEFGLRHNQPSSRLLASAHDRDESETAPLSNSTERSPTPLPTGPNSSSRAHLGFEEALRLLQVYEDLVGAMYPCVDMDSVRVYVQDYYGSHESITTSVADCQGSTPADQDWFFARDIQVLKLLLATALLAESHGRSELAAALADNVEDRFAARYKVAEVDMKEILIMTLLSIFHSYRDDEVISWRLIRNATSACMELGLHRQETWHRNGGVFPGELAWTWANRLFWCIYVLDRKWSFGSGLPFGMQDTDIDTDIPEPGESTPYLNCLISHARLSTKIWGLIMEWPRYSPSTTAIKCTELDDEVQQWIWSIPHELRFLPNLSFDSHVPTDRSRHSDRLMMLQVLLALQGNQLRILVYRQNLQSKERIAGDLAGASIAVETAKSTIHMLEYFSSVTNIYFDRPEPFNYFLISALAALLLAVLHAPSRFSHVCRPEFYTAINLVRRSATRARTSRRLQKLLRRLEQIQLHKGGDDHQAVTQSRSKDFVSRNSNGCTVEQRPSGPVAVTGLSAPHGSWEPTPESARTSTSVEHPTSNYERPMTSWNTSSGMDNDCSNVCENLSSFFKNAGDLLFDIDPTTSMELPSSSDASLARGVDVGFFSVPVNLQPPSQAFANFEDDNEELTRAMAGLL